MFLGMFARQWNAIRGTFASYTSGLFFLWRLTWSVYDVRRLANATLQIGERALYINDQFARYRVVVAAGTGSSGTLRILLFCLFALNFIDLFVAQLLVRPIRL